MARYSDSRQRRLPDHDYTSEGAYYFTVCTHKRIPYFGYYKKCRELAEEMWQQIPKHYPSVTLDAFAVLPDHIHGIVWLGPCEGKKPSLGNVVGIFKADISREWSRILCRVRKEPCERFWQPRFFDRVLRNEEELRIRREYVINNAWKHALKRGENPM